MAQIPTTRTTSSTAQQHVDDHNELHARHNEFEGQWPSYTPALTAATTNPSLGTSPTQIGSYTRVGRQISGLATIVFGTTPSAGSGEYRIGLPVTPRSTNSAGHNLIGHGMIFDSSVSALEHVELSWFAPGPFALLFRQGASGTLWQIRHDNPWPWAQGDFIVLQFNYEAAS